MPAAITAAPSNIAVSSSVGEANLEVRRSKFDVLEAILRASGGHHGDIWEVLGAILGILQAMSAEFGFEARVSDIFADFFSRLWKRLWRLGGSNFGSWTLFCGLLVPI